MLEKCALLLALWVFCVCLLGDSVSPTRPKSRVLFVSPVWANSVCCFQSELLNSPDTTLLLSSLTWGLVLPFHLLRHTVSLQVCGFARCAEALLPSLLPSLLGVCRTYFSLCWVISLSLVSQNLSSAPIEASDRSYLLVMHPLDELILI